MPLRFRQTFTLFPGVRINVGKRGISTSIGVPGASQNIGRQGVRATGSNNCFSVKLERMRAR